MNKYDKVNTGKPMSLQLYTKNYRELRNSESQRNVEDQCDEGVGHSTPNA